MKEKELLLPADCSLDDIAKSFVVKGIIIGDETSIGIETSEDLFHSFTNAYFEKGLFSSPSSNSYIISENNYSKFDFIANLSAYKHLLSLTDNDVNALQTLNSFKEFAIFLLPVLLILNFFGLYFLINGYAISFEKQKNLLYSLGYKRKNIRMIFLLFHGLLLFTSTSLALLIYFLSAKPLNVAIFQVFNSSVKYLLFNNHLFVILYSVIFVLLSLFFVAQYKTKKNMLKMLITMKKNLD